MSVCVLHALVLMLSVAIGGSLSMSAAFLFMAYLIRIRIVPKTNMMAVFVCHFIQHAPGVSLELVM